MTDTGDLINEMFGAPRQAAQQRAVGTIDADPEKAARALDLGQVTGVDPSVVYGDVENFEQIHKSTLASEIVKNNSFISDYINSHPLAASISNDDYGNLDKLSESVGKVAKSSAPGAFLRAAEKSVVPAVGSLPAMGAGAAAGAELGAMAAPFTGPVAPAMPIVGGLVGGALGAFGGGYLLSRLQDYVLDKLGLVDREQEAADISEHPYAQFAGALAPNLIAFQPGKIADSIIERALVGGSMAGLEAGQEAFHGEMDPAKVAMAGAFGAVTTRTTKFGEKGIALGANVVPRAKVESVIKDLQGASEAAKPYVDAGEEPPIGLHPFIDELKIESAKNEVDALFEALKDSQATSTRKRNAEMVAGFIRLRSDANIEVSAEAVRKLYGEEVPHADDNILGWQKDLEDQLTAAEATGGKVSIPLADWLAKVDPKVAQDLHDDIQVRRGSMTLNEAKELKEREAELKKEEEFDNGKEALTKGLEPLFEKGRGNAWIDVPEGRIYVRVGQHPGLGKTVELPNIVFDEEHQGTGAFTQYLHHVEKLTKEKGYDTVYVENLLNPRLEAFLRRNGYEGKKGEIPSLAKNVKDEAPIDQALVAADAVRQAAGLKDLKAKAIEIKKMGKGKGPAHQFAIMLGEQDVGRVKLIETRGGKSLYMDWIGADPAAKNRLEYRGVAGSLGHSGTRQVIQQIAEAFPNAETLGGYRISGAREKATGGGAVEIPLKSFRGRSLEGVNDEAIRQFSELIAEGESRQYGLGYEGWTRPKELYTENEHEIVQKVSAVLDRMLPKGGVSIAEHDVVAQHGREVSGAYINYRDREPVILWSLTADSPIGTIAHEGLHHLYREGFFTDSEWKVFEKAAKEWDWIRRYRINERYKGADQALKIEEAIVNAYGTWRNNRETVTPQGKLFQRLYDLFAQIKSAFREVIGKEPTFEDLFYKIEKGEIGSREGAVPLDPRAYRAASAEKEKPTTSMKQLGMEEMTRMEDRSLFKDLMPKERAERYGKLIFQKQEEDLAYQQRRAERDAKRRLTPEWKANEKRVRGEVDEAIRARPDVAVDEFFGKGILYGDKLSERPKLAGAELTEEQKAVLPKEYVAEKGGIHPDDAAQLFGYQSGSEMISKLSAFTKQREEAGLPPAKYLDKLVADTTEARMQKEYGDLQKNILEEAKEHVISPTQLDLLHEEVVAAGTKAGAQLSISKEDLQRGWKGLFSKLPVKGLSRDKYLDNAGRAGRAMELAALRQKWGEMFKEKQRQYASMFYAKEAKVFESLKARTDATIQKFMATEVVQGVDQAFTNQLRAMLEQVGYNSRFELPPDMPALQDFIKNNNGSVAVAHWLQDPKVRKTVDSMTVDEYRGFANSVRSMEHNGRQERKMNSAYGEAIVEDVERDVKAEVDRFDLVHQPINPTLVERLKSYGRFTTAVHFPTTKVFDYADKYSPEGPLTKFVDRRLRDSYNKEIELSEKVVRKLHKIEREFVDASITDSIPNDLISDKNSRTGFLNMNRHNLRILMSYMGTEARAEKVVRGFGLYEPVPPKTKFADEINAQAKATAIHNVHKFIDANANEKDWGWVQGMWGVFRDLKPEADAMQRRVTGVAVDTDPATTIPSRKFGSQKGGYFPLQYDPKRSNIANDVAGPLFDQHYVPATTPHSYTEPLTTYAAAIDLTGAMIRNKISAMVHDIAFREAVLDVNKLLKREGFKDAMAQKFGSEHQQQFMGWLKDIANVHNVDDSYALGLAKGSAFVRQNITSALTWANPGTVFKHGGTAAAFSAGEVGLGGFLKTLPRTVAGQATAFAKDIVGSVKSLWQQRDFEPFPQDYIDSLRDVTNPGERGDNTRDFVFGKSAFMRSRQTKFYDKIQGAYEAASEAGGFRKFMNVRMMSMNIGRFPVAVSDAFSALPTWLTEYKKGIVAGKDDKTSIYLADKAVVNAHGSGYTMDMPTMLRKGGEPLRWLTSYYHFWNRSMAKNTEIMWDIAAAAKGREEPNANIGSLTSRMFLYVAMPIIVEEMATAPLDEDHHGLGTKILLATTRFLGGGFIGLRDVTNGLAYGTEPSVGMVTPFYRELTRTGSNIVRAAKDKKVNDDWLTHAVTATSMLTGVGGAQAGRSGTFVKGWVQGKEIPKSFNELRQGLRTGHVKPRQQK